MSSGTLYAFSKHTNITCDKAHNGIMLKVYSNVDGKIAYRSKKLISINNYPMELYFNGVDVALTVTDMDLPLTLRIENFHLHHV